MQDLGSDSKEDLKIQSNRAFILPDNIRGKVYLDVKQYNVGFNFNILFFKTDANH